MLEWVLAATGGGLVALAVAVWLWPPDDTYEDHWGDDHPEPLPGAWPIVNGVAVEPEQDTGIARSDPHVRRETG